jgi:hypothetical protein
MAKASSISEFNAEGRGHRTGERKQMAYGTDVIRKSEIRGKRSAA